MQILNGDYTDISDLYNDNFSYTEDIVTKLTLVKLSKFNYTLTKSIKLHSTDPFSPKTLEEGYGTLYEKQIQRA